MSLQLISIIPCYIKDSNTTILPTVAQVQINFETPYAPDNFTSLEYFVILYVLEGTAIIHFPSRAQTLKTGELVILPPGLPHWCLHHPNDYVLNIISDKNHFEQNFFQLFKSSNMISDFFRHTLFQSSTDFLMFYLPVNDAICSLIAHLFSEYVSNDAYAFDVFNNYLQILYFNILRYCSSSYQRFHAKQNRTIELAMPSVIQYINDHYHELTLSTLADVFHYDAAYLCKMIKKYTSKNYSTLIADLKIEEAKRLLTQTSMHIEEISEASGFHSSDHFSHTFRKMTGMPPTVYRKQFFTNT